MRGIALASGVGVLAGLLCGLAFARLTAPPADPVQAAVATYEVQCLTHDLELPPAAGERWGEPCRRQVQQMMEALR